MDKFNIDKSKFNSKQWQEIQTGKEEDVDVSIYAYPKFYWQEMRDVRIALKYGIDLSGVIKKYSYGQINFLIKQLEKGLDISAYADPKFDATQMHRISEGVRQGVDVSIYADPSFTADQMTHILYGLTYKYGEN